MAGAYLTDMLRSALTMLLMFAFSFSLPLMFDRDGFFRFGPKTAMELNQGSDVALAPDLPKQRMLPEQDRFRIDLDGFEVRALAEYEVEALVLGRQNYDYDATSSISPTDLALAWGPVSAPAMRKYFRLNQMQRRSQLWISRNLPLRKDVFLRNFSNTHMIPADDEVRKALADVREGDLVSFSGYLVKVRSEGMRDWTSSFSRDDTGDGACEIVLVTRISTTNGRADT